MSGIHLFRDRRMWGVLLSPLLLLSSEAISAEALGTSAPAGAPLGAATAKGLSHSLQQAMESAATAAFVTVSPLATFTNAQYATAGVGLRNRQLGAIQISGVAAPVKRAYLYWAYLFSTSPAATQTAHLCNAALGCVSNSGALVATGADTCWKSQGIAIYRSDVTSIVKGNGLYQISLPQTASATNSGADPWTSLTFPAAEGAALVVVGTGKRNVAIYDKGIAGATFFGSTSYELNIPGGVKTTPVQWDNIGADGQTSANGASGVGVGKEKTYVNGMQIAGPGVDVTANGVTDSDWDGVLGSPLPRLFDVTSHILPAAATPVGKTSLAVSFSSVGETFDCLTPVANVIAY